MSRSLLVPLVVLALLGAFLLLGGDDSGLVGPAPISPPPDRADEVPDPPASWGGADAAASAKADAEPAPARGDAVVAGVVRIGGGPPLDPLPLRAFTIDPTMVSNLEVATDADGRFRFEGLPDDWDGFVCLPPGYELLDGGGNTVALAGDVDLVIEARRRDEAIGRVLNADGTPAANAWVDLDCSGRDGWPGESGATTDRAGRFAIALPADPPVHASLTVRSPSGVVEVERAVDVARLSGPVDYGDLVLPAERTVVLLVTDSDGNPVTTATVAIEDRASTRPGAGDGRLELTLPATAVTLRVEAYPYETRRIELSPGALSPFPVRLDRAARLRVAPRGPDGAPAEGVVVMVSAKEDLFVEEPDGGLRVPVATSLPDAGGWCDFGPFRPGVRFRVEVLDRWSDEVLFAEEVSLGRGEWRELRPRIADPGRSFVGRVVDEANRPVVGANVRLRVDVGGWSQIGRTGPDGVFRASGVRARRVFLRVWSRDHLPFETEVTVPLDGRVLRFALAAGRVVTLHVVDEEGRPVASARAAVWVGGSGHGANLGRDGTFEFRTLPAGRVRFSVRYAGGVFEIQHDTAMPDATIRVPHPGSLRITLPGGREGDHVLRVVPAEDDGTPCASVCREGDGERRFEPVLPGTYRVELRVLRGGALVAAADAVVVTADRETTVDLSR